MHCNNIQEMRGAVTFTDEEYSKEADTVGLGMARPRRAGRAKRSLSVSLMLSRPVIERMKLSLIASSSGWRSDDMSGMVRRVQSSDIPCMNKSTVGSMRLSLGDQG